MMRLWDNLAADLHLYLDAMATLDGPSDPNPAPYPYGPFGSAQRDRMANGPEPSANSYRPTPTPARTLKSAPATVSGPGARRPALAPFTVTQRRRQEDGVHLAG